MLDGHIHIENGAVDRGRFLGNLRESGIGGGLVISQAPPCFTHMFTGRSFSERLENLFDWVGDDPDLFPFYWIDPIEEGAEGQVAAAEARGVRGYKVICGSHFPGDARAMATYRRIAEAGKPILFHSGILWDGADSSRYNRPAEFEALLDVEGLKFALAHISWPWCDECIALYGKFLNARSRRPGKAAEMFVDVTPGTPPIFRREALMKLFGTGYDVENNVIFGTDCNTVDYNRAWASEWMDRDNRIYEELGLSAGVRKGIFGGNLLRFVGASEARVDYRPLVSGKGA